MYILMLTTKFISKSWGLSILGWCNSKFIDLVIKQQVRDPLILGSYYKFIDVLADTSIRDPEINVIAVSSPIKNHKLFISTRCMNHGSPSSILFFILIIFIITLQSHHYNHYHPLIRSIIIMIIHACPLRLIIIIIIIHHHCS
jgi:hypothetical protein